MSSNVLESPANQIARSTVAPSSAYSHADRRPSKVSDARKQSPSYSYALTPATPHPPSTHGKHPSAAEIVWAMSQLFDQQIEVRKRLGRDYSYIESHRNNSSVILGHIDTVCSYYAESEHTRMVLDWGCSHAIDSCAMRMLTERGDVQFFGCDVQPSEDHTIFHQFAGLQYHQLTHPYQLPYADQTFDLVVGSGAIEHVPDESASLRELHRILKVKGKLVLTYIPNKWSIAEALLRMLGYLYHRRLYRLRQVKEMLLRHGFAPVQCRYHHVTPTLSGACNLSRYALWRKCVEWLYRCNPVLEWLPPFCYFGQNIMAVATREESL